MLISDLNDLSDAIQWCDVCRGHQDGACDDCHATFGGSESRYRSQTYHFHPAAVEGVSGTRAIQKELCVECYRLDHAKAYPNHPVPDLPDRGVDPKYHADQVREARRKILNNVLNSIRNHVPIGEVDQKDQELLAAVIKIGLRFM